MKSAQKLQMAFRRQFGLAALAWSVACGAAVAASDVPPPIGPYVAPQTLVRLPDGRRYNLVCMGAGAPVAILDAGLGDWSIDWRAIQPEFAKITRTCAVDRPGYGFSGPGPLPRDGAAEVSDLENALRASGIHPPYVLVGHSLGGLNARLFAYRNPDKVAGLLLIDPAFEHFWKRLPQKLLNKQLAVNGSCLAQARAGKLVPGEIRSGDSGACVPAPEPQWTPEEKSGFVQVQSRASAFEAAISEASSVEATSDEVEAARRKLGVLPLVVLSQDKAHFLAMPGGNADLYAAWIAAHDDEAHESTRGENRFVDGAGHYIYQDRPDAVISAFRQVVEMARDPGAASQSK